MANSLFEYSIVYCLLPFANCLLRFSKCLIQRFGAVLHMQFFVNVVYMLAHSAGGDGKFCSNLFIQ